MCSVCALRASNTLCMRCQLASFSQILTKVGRTATHWSSFSFFYARTVRRVCVTGPYACTQIPTHTTNDDELVFQCAGRASCLCGWRYKNVRGARRMNVHARDAQSAPDQRQTHAGRTLGMRCVFVDEVSHHS